MNKNRAFTLFLMITGILVLGPLVFWPRAVQAADFRGGDVVIIKADEVIDDDLFISANRVEVRGTVLGDLFATGAEVSVSGIVEGSLGISGQTLTVDGQVGGSVYSGGYALVIGSEATVGRNVYFGGFSLELEDGVQVGRGVYMGGYQAIVDGEVAGDVAVGSGALQVNGVVRGDVVGSVGDPDRSGTPFMPNFPGAVPMISPGLRVADDAVIDGILDVEETEFATTGPDGGPSAGFASLAVRVLRDRIGEFLAVVLVGGLLLRFWSGGLQTLSEALEEKPLPSTGWGFVVSLVFFLGIPVVAVAIFLLALLGGLVTFGQLFSDILSVGGASLGLVIASFGFVLSIVTKAVVAFLVGRLLVDLLAAQTEPGGWKDFASLAVGAVIYGLLRTIPVLGWFVGVAATLAGLGAIFYVVRRRWIRPDVDADASTEPAA